MAQRRLLVTLLAERRPQDDVRAIVIRIKAQGFLALGDDSIRITIIKQHGAEVTVSVTTFRLEAQGFAVLGDGPSLVPFDIEIEGDLVGERPGNR